MNKHLHDILACPTCRERLATDHGLSCLKCGAVFEEQNGIPILLDEESRREISKFYQGRIGLDREKSKQKKHSIVTGLVYWFTHPPSRKIGDVTVPNLQKLWGLLKESGGEPKVLMIGKYQSQINGQRVDSVAEIQALEAASIRLDITPRVRVDAVGDGHKLPFLDNSFDAAVALTTLKHLRNPFRFVGELHRVLKPGGLVYAQCVSLAPYHRWPGDYVHFTSSGIVQLFSQFEPLQTGVNGGPGYTISRLLPYYLGCLLSFNNRRLYGLVRLGSAWAIAPIRYLDYFLTGNRWKDFVAYGNYFLGRKVR